MSKKLTNKQKNMLGSAAAGLSGGIGLGTSLAQINDSSSQKALIESVGSTQFSTGNYDSLMNSFDATNMARTNYTVDEIRGFTDAQLAGNILASTATGALSGAMKGGWVGALVEGGSNLIGGTVGALVGNAKAQKKAAELNSLAEENNKIYLNNFANAASNTQNKMFNNSLLNIAADGGFLDGNSTDWDKTLTGKLISYTENRDSLGFDSKTRRWYAPDKKGYDPNNRGMGVDINYLPKGITLHKDGDRTYLTEEEERKARYAKLDEANNSYNQRLKYAQKVTGSNNIPSEYKKALVMDAIYNFGSGNVANILFEDKELMNLLLNGTDEAFKAHIQQYWDKNSGKAIKSRAERIQMQNNFLKNNKSYGGPLYTLGGDYSNGIVFIDEGGTHEQNPFGGVPMGVDQEGIPNLVEEGEIIYNDYVFSNRLKPTKTQLESVGFSSDKYEDWTFAKIVEDLQRESAERPTDIISKAGLEDMIGRLTTIQEEVRAKKQEKETNEFAYGGDANNEEPDKVIRNLNSEQATALEFITKLDEETFAKGIQPTKEQRQQAAEAYRILGTEVNPDEFDGTFLGYDFEQTIDDAIVQSERGVLKKNQKRLDELEKYERNALRRDLRQENLDLFKDNPEQWVTQQKDNFKDWLTDTKLQRLINKNNREQKRLEKEATRTERRKQRAEDRELQKLNKELDIQFNEDIKDSIKETEDYLQGIFNQNNDITPKFMEYSDPEILDEKGLDEIAESLTTTENNLNSDFLRYISPLIHAGTLLNNLKEPDYSNIDVINKIAQQIPGGNFTPLGDYLNLQPIDTNVVVNPILASSAANRRAIQNQSINAGQAIAGLLTNDYITNKAIGDALIQGIQANNNIKSANAEFNRGTNQVNSQMGLQALAMDQQRAQQILNAQVQSSSLRNALDTLRSQSIGASLTGLANDLAGIGRESKDGSILQTLIDLGVIEDIFNMKGNKTSETPIDRENTAETSVGKYGGRLLTKKRR